MKDSIFNTIDNLLIFAKKDLSEDEYIDLLIGIKDLIEQKDLDLEIENKDVGDADVFYEDDDE